MPIFHKYAGHRRNILDAPSGFFAEDLRRRPTSSATTQPQAFEFGRFHLVLDPCPIRHPRHRHLFPEPFLVHPLRDNYGATPPQVRPVTTDGACARCRNPLQEKSEMKARAYKGDHQVARADKLERYEGDIAVSIVIFE